MSSDLLSRAPAPPAEPRVEPAEPGWATLAVVLAGTLLTFLDFFIVNVGLPAIRTDLDAGPGALSLVVAGYGLTFAVGMITGGRLGDRYGRRRLFVLGVAAFTVTSAACGLAPGAGVLVAARLLQGAAGALLTPQVLAILGATYSGTRRATAFAAYGVAMGVAGVLGQLLGGALIDWNPGGLGWRTIFLVNVPIGLVAAVAARRHVPESHGARTRIDVLGLAISTAALVAVVLPLVEGREQGWPVWTWLALAAAPVLGAVFVAQQSRRGRAGRAPLVDLVVFRARGFAAGCAAALTFALVPPSFFFVLALYLQTGRGLDALASGVVFVAVGAGYFVAMFAAGPLAARWGRQVLAVGSLVVAAGCGCLVATAHAGSAVALVPGLALVGCGIGLVLVPLTASVLAGVDPLHAGAAAGVLATSQQIGGAIGVAVIGTVFFAGSAVVPAFTTCLVVIAALTVATVLLVQRLPRGQASR